MTVETVQQQTQLGFCCSRNGDFMRQRLYAVTSQLRAEKLVVQLPIIFIAK
jgi:hypothetical protein